MRARHTTRRSDKQGKDNTTWGVVREGTTAVVIRGARAQIGELVVIVRKCAVMVQVRFSDEAETAQGMKRPDSLLFLEDGLVLQRDRRGHLWVVRRANEEQVEGQPHTTSFAIDEDVAVAHLVEE